MGSLDMSQNQNGISSRFFKPKFKPKLFLLNWHPDPEVPDAPAQVADGGDVRRREGGGQAPQGGSVNVAST